MSERFPGMRFSKMDYVRPWRFFFQPLNMTAESMFGSKFAPHLHCFTQRGSLPLKTH